MPRAASPPKLDASMRVVVVHGSDQYLRAAYTTNLVEALEAEYGEIERFTFDGLVTDAAAVLDELRSYGLLQTHKLVVLDNADKFLVVKEETSSGATPPNLGRSNQGRSNQGRSNQGRSSQGRQGRSKRGGPPPRKTARQLLEKYAADPVESATLLLRADTWRRGKLDAAIEKHGAILKCETPDNATAARFCVRRCEKAHGAKITPEAATMLVDRIGPILARLDAELGKLAAFVGEGGTVGPDEVRTLVGLSREEQAWSIQSALVSGSAAESLTKLRELLEVSRQPEQLLTWAMTDLLRKLHSGSQLSRQGMPAATIARELKLWGSGRDKLLDAARRIGPEAAAHLLQSAIDSDLRTKSGIGKAPRTLEALAVLIADTMS